MQADLLYPYTIALSVLCAALAWAAERWLTPRLAGPFAAAYRTVLRNGRWSAIVTGGILIYFLYGQSRGSAAVSLHAQPWATLPWVVQLHIVTAVVAMILGPTVLLRPKGDRTHRWLGRTWALSMYVLAFSGLHMWLSGRPNVLILFSVLGAASVTAGLVAAWTRRIDLHLRFMLGAYMGLLAAAAFSLMPGRWVANAILALF